MGNGFYKLIGKKVVPATKDEFRNLIADKNRFLETTETRGCLISTVFLVSDHNFKDEGLPILFETVVFDQNMKILWKERYSTYEDAVKGHMSAVKMVEDNLLTH